MIWPYLVFTSITSSLLLLLLFFFFQKKKRKKKPKKLFFGVKKKKSRVLISSSRKVCRPRFTRYTHRHRETYVTNCRHSHRPPRRRVRVLLFAALFRCRRARQGWFGERFLCRFAKKISSVRRKVKDESVTVRRRRGEAESVRREEQTDHGRGTHSSLV